MCYEIGMMQFTLARNSTSESFFKTYFLSALQQIFTHFHICQYGVVILIIDMILNGSCENIVCYSL